MPPKKKGGNNRRFGPKTTTIEYADLSIGQHYAYVEKAYGNCQFEVTTINGDSRKSSLCGKLKRRGRICMKDLVLIEPISEDENGQHVIIFKYAPGQKSILQKEGYLKAVEEKKETHPKDDFLFEGEEVKENETIIELDENFVDLI